MLVFNEDSISVVVVAEKWNNVFQNWSWKLSKFQVPDI